MPYLALGDRDVIRIGDVEIWNFDRQRNSVADPEVRTRITELLGMYRQNGRTSKTNARLRGIGVVAIGKRDFQRFSEDALQEVQEARHLLFLCCLAHNCLLYGPNAGPSMVTSENFELIRQNFTFDSEYLSETTGVLLQLTIGGYTIAETTFTKPSYVNLPFRFATDERLLHALIQLKPDNPQLFRRIARAAALFLESYYNSQSVDIGARILLQVAAFEILLELPEKRQRKAFKDAIESLVNTPGEKTYQYRFETPAGERVERRTLKGMWADRFYTLRNHIIHGELVRPREFRFLRAQHHLLIAPLIFTHVVKRLIEGASDAERERRLFLERVDWTVIFEGDEFEPRQIGFQARADTQARLQQWIESRERAE